MSTSTHIRTPCPNCQARLRVNPEYVGRVVTCKLCGHSFPCARADDPAPASPIPEPEPVGGGPAAATPPNGKTPTTVEDAAQKVLTRLLARNQKYVLLKQRFAQAVDRCAALDEQVRELRDGLDRDRDSSGPVVSLLQELEEVRAARDELMGRLDEARATAAEAEALGGELRAARADLERLQDRAADLERALAEAARTAKAWESGWESERRTLTDQVEAARQAWDSERQALVDQSEAAHQALIDQAEDTRQSWESERQALIDQAEAARRAWEVERQALVERAEAESRAVRADVDRLHAERAGMESALGQRAATEGALAERETRLTEALGRTEALGAELRAAHADQERLQDRVADLERALAEAARTAEASRQTWEAGWESERQARADQAEDARRTWDSERQALIDQSEAAHQALTDQVEAARREWESERQALTDQAEAARREWESERQARAARAEAETARWEERLGAARDLSERERAALQGDLKRLRQESDALRNERDALQGERATTLRLIETLTQERAEVTAAREQVKGAFSAGEKVYQAKIAQLTQALHQATHEGEAARRRGDELAGQVGALQAELERQRQDLQAERARAEERAAAGERSPEESDALRDERATMLRLIEALSQDRARITAFRDQLRASFQEAERGYQAQIAQLNAALRQADRGAAAAPAIALERGGRRPDGGRPDNGVSPESAAAHPAADALDRDAMAHRDAALSQIGPLLDGRK